MINAYDIIVGEVVSLMTNGGNSLPMNNLMINSYSFFSRSLPASICHKEERERQ